MTAEQTLLIFVTLFIAAIAQGCTGFGLGLIALPVLAWSVPGTLPELLIATSIPISAWQALRNRRLLHPYRQTAVLLSARVMGSMLGLVVVAALSPSHLRTAFGLATLTGAALIVIAPPSTKLTNIGLASSGIASGIMATSSGLGGPPLMLVLAGSDGELVRGLVGVVTLVGNLVSLFGIWWIGSLQIDELLAVVWVAPAVFAGMVASHWLIPIVDGKYLRILILGFAFASAGILLVGG